MRQMVETGSKVNSEANTAESFTFELLAFLAILLCLAVSARAQNVDDAPAIAGSARKILVSIPDRKLALMEDGRAIRIYQIAVGAPVSPSPSGEFHIVSRLSTPTYYHPGKVIPPGPENPLGTRWMGLSIKGYGIHGTNLPRSIGKAASHGCFRMRRKDLEELFELVRVGDVVEIRSQSDDETAAIFDGEQPLQLAAVADGTNGQQ